MREGSKIEWSVLWRLNPCGPVDIPDRQRLKNQRHLGSSCVWILRFFLFGHKQTRTSLLVLS